MVLKEYKVTWKDDTVDTYWANRTWTSDNAIQLLREKKKGDGFDTVVVLNVNEFKKLEDLSL